MNNEEHNLVTTFLLPLIGLPEKVLRAKAKKEPRIINAYLCDEEVDYWNEGHLFLLYRGYQSHLPSDEGSVDNFNVFEESLRKNKRFVDSYELCKGALMVAIFNIDDIAEYELFIEGKYSEFSPSSKNKCIDACISTIWDSRANSTKNTLMHIFRRSKERQRAFEEYLKMPEGSMDGLELCSKWSIEKEVLTSEIKEKLTKNFTSKIKFNENYSNL